MSKVQSSGSCLQPQCMGRAEAQDDLGSSLDSQLSQSVNLGPRRDPISKNKVGCDNRRHQMSASGLHMQLQLHTCLCTHTCTCTHKHTIKNSKNKLWLKVCHLTILSPEYIRVGDCVTCFQGWMIHGGMRLDLYHRNTV